MPQDDGESNTRRSEQDSLSYCSCTSSPACLCVSHVAIRTEFGICCPLFWLALVTDQIDNHIFLWQWLHHTEASAGRCLLLDKSRHQIDNLGLGCSTWVSDTHDWVWLSFIIADSVWNNRKKILGVAEDVFRLNKFIEQDFIRSLSNEMVSSMDISKSHSERRTRHF